MVIAMVSTTDMYSLAPLQVWERAAIGIVLLWLLNRKYMVKILIVHKYYVRHLNENFEIFLVGRAVL